VSSIASIEHGVSSSGWLMSPGTADTYLTLELLSHDCCQPLERLQRGIVHTALDSGDLRKAGPCQVRMLTSSVHRSMIKWFECLVRVPAYAAQVDGGR
jgi:hypothetical protein